MAFVYDAFDTEENRAVAIKIPHASVLASGELRARFEREAFAAITVDHPGVVRAFELGHTADGVPYLVFERARGDSLHQALSYPVPWSRAAALGSQIARAVEALHTRGIVHRDLKPENILVARGEKNEDLIKVLDFGLAKLCSPEPAPSEGLTRLGFVYGTPEYMAPEQALGQEVDERADVYSVGVILYELVSGRRPYSGKANQLLGQQLTLPLPSLRDLAGPEVPVEFEQLVAAMLAVTCGARPKMSEVREKLEGFVSPLGRAHSRAKPPRTKVARKAIRFPYVVLVGVLSASLGAVVALSLHHERAMEPAVSGLALHEPTPALAPEPTKPTKANRAEDVLESLSSPSLDDLVVLSREHSSEPLIQLALAEAYLGAREYSNAVETATMALGLDPSLNRSPRLGAILQKTAQMQSAAEATFRLLRGPMGQEGADILYDLSLGQNVRPLIRAQAATALESADVRENLSLPLALALDLAAAHSCKELKPLIERALILGDERSLVRLEGLQNNLECKRPGLPCYPCLRKMSELHEAIAAIRARSPDSEASRRP